MGSTSACSRADVIKLQPQSHLQSHHGSHFFISNHLILLTKTHTHDPLMGSGAGSGKIRERPGANCVFRLRHVFLRHTCRVGSLPSNSSCGRPRHGVAPDAIAVVAVLGSGSPRRSADRHPGVGTRPTLLPTPPRRPPQPSTVSTSPPDPEDSSRGVSAGTSPRKSSITAAQSRRSARA